MPQQVPDLASRLRALGFKGDPRGFADLTGQPMGAVVSLGGCSASFVSPEGLIVTNHHCVTAGLQFNSTAGRNLLRDGFLARTREEELQHAPGSRVFVTTAVTDVTSGITGNIDPKVTDRQRFDIIDKRVKQRVASCEGSGQRCTVASFFEGLKYFEIAQLEIKDVRLVYAPAKGIGVFGGETDNWRWPRHTGDWSFLRAYVGKDGRPAPFSKDNVPYRPKQWLKVATEGIKPGDLVFVTGYPGRTERHEPYTSIQEITEWYMPRAIQRAKEQLAIIDQVSAQDSALKIKLANRIQSLNNGLTNMQGTLEGLVKGGSLRKKEAQEQDLERWITADPARRSKYGDVLPKLRAIQAEAMRTREQAAELASLTAASSYLAAARNIWRLAEEKPKPDVERESGFQERDWTRIREAHERVQRTMDPTADKALLRWALGYTAALPADQRIAALDSAIGLRPGMPPPESQKLIDMWVDKLYSNSKLADRDFLLGLLQKSSSELLATGDPFIKLAAELEPLAKQNREAAKNRSGARARVAPIYMEAMLAKEGGLVAPDANSTLRVTYGQVKGVDAKDGLYYKPQTTLKGILEKNTGQGDFDAPKRQLAAIEGLQSGRTKTPYIDPALGNVPVNFLSTVDTTGGNSGSPTLNGRGELVGLLFDGTYESVASNYIFDPITTRSIHVDIRYMLWNMSEVDDAGHLVNEMMVQSASTK